MLSSDGSFGIVSLEISAMHLDVAAVQSVTSPVTEKGDLVTTIGFILSKFISDTFDLQSI